MMTRRGILGLFASALALDPEHLLWKADSKLISIPAVRAKERHHLSVTIPEEDSVYDAREFHLRYIAPAMAAICNEIDRMAYHAIAKPVFLPLEHPMDLPYTQFTENKEFRILRDVDLLNLRMITRVDALVEL